MNIEEQLNDVKERLKRVEAEVDKPYKFWAKNVIAPVLVALIGVLGGVTVAVQSNISAQQLLMEQNQTARELLEIKARGEAITALSKSATRFTGHINDLVEARNKGVMDRKMALEDKITDDLADVSGCISTIENIFSDNIKKEAASLKDYLISIDTNNVEEIKLDHDFYKKMKAFRDMVSKEAVEKNQRAKGNKSL